MKNNITEYTSNEIEYLAEGLETLALALKNNHLDFLLFSLTLNNMLWVLDNPHCME